MAVIYPDYVARFYDIIYASVRSVDRAYYLRKIAGCKGRCLKWVWAQDVFSGSAACRR